MKTTRALFLIPLALLLLPVSYAATPTTGTGTFTLVSATTTSARTADGNTIITQNLMFTIAGAETGNIAFHGTTVVLSTGNSVAFGTGTLAGSVLGRSGTIVFRAEDTAEAGVANGQFVFLSGTGTGELANLHGQGMFQFGGTTGTYSVTAIFT